MLPVCFLFFVFFLIRSVRSIYSQQILPVRNLYMAQWNSPPTFTLWPSPEMPAPNPYCITSPGNPRFCKANKHWPISPSRQGVDDFKFTHVQLYFRQIRRLSSVLASDGTSYSGVSSSTASNSDRSIHRGTASRWIDCTLSPLLI